MAHTSLSQIPFAYRFVFLYFEPAGALLGSILLHFHPQPFLSAMSPSALYTASNQVVYDMLAATYVLFAFNEAVLFRLTNDRLVWRTVLLGILLCDTLHLYGSWSALGGEVFWNPMAWRWEDAVNLGSLWGQGALRIAFLLGVGLEDGASKGRKD